MKFQKLVRDLIPQLIEENGDEAVTRVLEQEEYLEALKSKLQEEVSDYLESEDPEELADIAEVVSALLAEHATTEAEFTALRQKKLEEQGGFTARIYLEETIEN
jgi:predicted house-cleaning noncanonical NTP pyrophosphatase (MazG superfamily)